MKEIFERRSCRSFEDRKVEAGKLEKLLQAAMAAPTAKNQREWEYIVVTERELREKLADASPYAACVKDAPVAIVLLANISGLDCPEYWEQDMSTSAENILLEAVHLGLGAVWLGIAPDEERMRNVIEIFDLPENVLPFAIIPVGYPVSEGKAIDRYDTEKIFYNGYKVKKNAD